MSKVQISLKGFVTTIYKILRKEKTFRLFIPLHEYLNRLKSGIRICRFSGKEKIRRQFVAYKVFMFNKNNFI